MILVTGATGFVGNRLVNKLVSQHKQIRCLVRGHTSEIKKIGKEVEILEGDLLNKDIVNRVVKGVQKVIHLAAALQASNPEDIRRINVEGTRDLVTSCVEHGVEQFIFFSTLNVTLPVKNQYSKTKSEAEQIVQESGLGFTILRPSIIYGEGDNGTISQIIKSVKTNKRITLLGNGEYRLQPVYIDDVVNAICEVLNNSHSHKRKTYFLVGQEIVSYNELVGIISDVTGFKTRKQYVPIPVVNIIAAALSLFSKKGVLLKDKLKTYPYDKVADRDSSQKDIFPIQTTSLANGLSKCI